MSKEYVSLQHCVRDQLQEQGYGKDLIDESMIRWDHEGRSRPDGEYFHVRGLQRCPDEKDVADMATDHYRRFGFEVDDPFSRQHYSVAYRHEDGRRIRTSITASPICGESIVSITSIVKE